jgi:signal transduction histidine kinase
MKPRSLKRTLSRLYNTGSARAGSPFQQGLVRLSNKATLLVLAIVNLILLPLALINKFTIPILLTGSLFLPLILYFNHRNNYVLARHSLLVVLYGMMLFVSLYRGLDSGILFLSIPAILLSIIFFYRSQSSYVHLTFLLGLMLFIVWFNSNGQPFQPYAPEVQLLMYLTHLLIAISLTTIFADFFYTLTQQYQQTLEKLNSTKTQLLSIISHDLKSPLNSLLGVLSLVNNRLLSQEEFYQLTGKLERQATLLNATLNNLLLWSLSQMQGIKTRPETIPLEALVAEVVGLLKQLAVQKGVALSHAVSPGPAIWADYQHIHLVLRNLISNAIKFTPAGGSISIEARQDQEGVVFSVSDTGIGIPPNKIDLIFDHKELDSTKGTHGESGTGIGLPLSREMVELNGGRIWVDSIPGGGSSFHVWMPSAVRTHPAASGQEPLPEQHQPPLSQAGTTSPASSAS